MSKTYVVMKDGVKVKTVRSLAKAKEVAEGAEIYCNGELVYPSGAALTAPETYRLKVLMNVREAPSLAAKIIAHAEAGKVINVYEIRDDWMKVVWNDGFAYILYKNGEFAEAAKS